jgi:hypothetical protein
MLYKQIFDIYTDIFWLIISITVSFGVVFIKLQGEKKYQDCTLNISLNL